MAEGTTKRPTYTSICSFCKGEFGKGQMTLHLKSCKQRVAQNNLEAESSPKMRRARKTRLLHLQVEGYYRPMYWLHLEMPDSATLRTLDDFLRGIWLECCGHLSAFRIGNVSYMSHGDEGYFDMEPMPEAEAASPQSSQSELSELQAELAAMFEGKKIPAVIAQLMEGMDSYMPDIPEEHDMSVKLSKVLSVGMKFSYEYDFGSTTTLKLKVVAEREGEPRRGKKTVQILARNVPPVIPCDLCGKPATLIAGEGYYEEGGVNAVCDECSEKRPDDEDGGNKYYGGYDMYEEMLPVVNSPRIGVCGYTGD